MLTVMFFLSALVVASPVVTPRADGCDPRCGEDEICIAIDDKGSACVVPQVCGGHDDLQCDNEEQVCIDDPRDDCDPFQGGVDCAGMCV